MNLDEASDDFRHCFFGCCQNESHEYILPSSKRLFTWKKKEHKKPLIYNENKEPVIHMSLTSQEFCMRNKLGTVKEDKRFDVNLPCHWGRNRYYIAEGNRWNWCRMIIPKLLMRCFYLNEKFHESWTIEDLLNTFEWVVNKNVVKANEFIESEDYKSLCLWIDEKYSRLKTMKYEDVVSELSGYFENKTRQYKNRKYLVETCKDIIYQHEKYIDGQYIVLFTDKEEMLELLNSLSITERYFKDFVSKTKGNFTIQFESVPTRSDKGKTKLDLTKYQYNKNNQLMIPKKDITPYIRNYCSKNKIKIKTIK